MTDATLGLLELVPVVVTGGVIIGLTTMMLGAKNNGKSMSLLDSVK